jgi:hypothetical protein
MPHHRGVDEAAMSTRTAPRPQPSHGRRTTPTARAKAKRARSTTATANHHRRRSLLLRSIALTAVAGLIGAMMWSARTTSDPTSRPAPDFTNAKPRRAPPTGEPDSADKVITPASTGAQQLD